MRIHTNILTRDQIDTALSGEVVAGRIAESVSFKVLEFHGSRARGYAFEVQLEAGRPGQGRRVGNSGSYGALHAAVDGYAATFDEWGWLLAALYQLDPAMLVGSPTLPTYGSAAHFARATGLSFMPGLLADAIERSGDPYPYVTGRGAHIKRGYLIGRRGAGRLGLAEGASYAARGWPVAEHPRTIEEVAEFARLDLFALTALASEVTR